MPVTKPLNRKLRTSLFALLVTLAVPAGALAGILPADALPRNDAGLPTLAPMLRGVMPAVVNISTKSHIRVEENPLLQDPFFRRFFDVPEQPRERVRQSLGSGVIIDARKGYVITNNHVIDKADEITVTLRDNRTLEAKLIGTDPEADLAVVQIKAKDLTALPVADSAKVAVGDFVVAIGNPFGLNQTVTSGIVSALGRSGLGIEGYENFIQTDASINPGNSGGALVDLKGRLVGINTAIVGPAGGNVGIGFAIPSNMVMKIADQLIAHGRVERGQLGVVAQDVTPDLAEALGLKRAVGAVVAQVVEGSAAAKAGIQVGDVIVNINGQTVRDAAQLRNAVGLLPVGEQLTLDILRNGKPVSVTLTVTKTKLRKADAGKANPVLAGAHLTNINPDHPLAGQVEGVEVAQIERGSPAALSGLRPGDIIVSINRRRVTNLDEAQQLLAAAKGKRLLLNIRRGNGALFLVIG